MVAHLAKDGYGCGSRWRVFGETSGFLAQVLEKIADEPPHFPGSSGIPFLAGFDECIAQLRLDPDHQLCFLVLAGLFGLLFSFSHK